MKIYSALALGFIIATAACSDDTNNTTQAQIDSAANARSSAMETQMKLKNDSLINAMATMKADSILRQDSISTKMKASTPQQEKIPVKSPPLVNPSSKSAKTLDQEHH